MGGVTKIFKNVVKAVTGRNDNNNDTTTTADKQYAQDTTIEEGASDDQKRKFSKANRMKGQLRSSTSGSEGTAGANV